MLFSAWRTARMFTLPHPSPSPPCVSPSGAPLSGWPPASTHSPGWWAAAAQPWHSGASQSCDWTLSHSQRRRSAAWRRRRRRRRWRRRTAGRSGNRAVGWSGGGSHIISARCHPMKHVGWLLHRLPPGRSVCHDSERDAGSSINNNILQRALMLFLSFFLMFFLILLW